MAKGVRFEPGGFVVEAIGLTMQEAKEPATRVAEPGDPPSVTGAQADLEEDEDRPSDAGD